MNSTACRYCNDLIGLDLVGYFLGAEDSGEKGEFRIEDWVVYDS